MAGRPLSERFDRAAACGFEWVEFLFPQEHDPAMLDTALARSGLLWGLFDMAVGDRMHGERGLLTVRGRERDFAAAVEEDLQRAFRWGVRYLNALGGIPLPDVHDDPVATAVGNLRGAAERCDAHGVVATVEFVNGRDIPGYGLRSLADAARVVRQVDHPAVRLQFDQYHVEMAGLDPLEQFRLYQEIVAYVQVAVAPGWHEPLRRPNTLEAFLELLDASDYGGLVGLEYDPTHDTESCLRWLDKWLA